jgi:diguanylate cyclase (GGDEF)-like protein
VAVGRSVVAITTAMPAAAALKLQLLAVGVFAVVFALFGLLERPGLGIAHGYYLAVILAGLATGPARGALAGILATTLYAFGVMLNSHVQTASLLTIATSIRTLTFISVGIVVGFYASRTRSLTLELERIADEHRVLASRDRLTGLPNTRAFEIAVTSRLDAGEPFTLLVGDLDGLKRVNEHNGYDEGNDTLRRFAETVTERLAPTADVARIGDDELAILVRLGFDELPSTIAARLEQQLAGDGVSATFGWAAFPAEATTALGLYRIADERLYARKILRGRRLERVESRLPIAAHMIA